MASSIKVEGLQDLLKQFEGMPNEILTAANEAAVEAMGPALDSARSSSRFNDTGRKNSTPGNPAHPAGNLRSKLQLFFVRSVRKGKTRVWASLGVPYGQGAAYYIPLALGHKKVNKADARPYFEDAFKAVQGNATAKITAAVNGVLNRYRSEPPK